MRIDIEKAQGNYMGKLRQRRYILNVLLGDARPKEIKHNGRILNSKSEDPPQDGRERVGV